MELNMSFNVADIVVLLSALVSVGGAFFKLKSEVRHLDDTKAERSELEPLLSEIRISLARIEEQLKTKMDVGNG